MEIVSIIVPVYNCESYLERCVNSVLQQTEQNLQVILVDDGSSDGSGALCDRFADTDSRVTVIHQKNAGVSAARNAALEVATGDYIGFVDADDYISKESYAVALEAMEDADIVMWDTVTVWDNGNTAPDTIPLLEEECIVGRQDWTPQLLAQMAGSACRCLYRRKLLTDVTFPVGIKLSEDRLFNIHAMGKAEKLCYLKRGMYYRYVRKNSAVHRYHGDRFEKNLVAMEKAKELLERYWSEEYLEIYTGMFPVGGALSAVYEICSKSFPGKSRLKAIRAITEHPALKEAFSSYRPVGIREKLLQKRMNLLLEAVGFLYNWKNS